MRPLFATVTPVGIAPLNVATTPSLPIVWSFASSCAGQHTGKIKSRAAIEIVVFILNDPCDAEIQFAVSRKKIYAATAAPCRSNTRQLNNSLRPRQRFTFAQLESLQFPGRRFW